MRVLNPNMDFMTKHGSLSLWGVNSIIGLKTQNSNAFSNINYGSMSTKGDDAVFDWTSLV